MDVLLHHVRYQDGLAGGLPVAALGEDGVDELQRYGSGKQLKVAFFRREGLENRTKHAGNFLRIVKDYKLRQTEAAVKNQLLSNMFGVGQPVAKKQHIGVGR